MTSLETLIKRAGPHITPAWEVALLFPEQGMWSEEEYLHLTNQTSRLVEFADGVVEVLPMPSERHQDLVAFLYELLLRFARATGGKVYFAPFRIQLRSGKYREPDLVFLRSADDPRRQSLFWAGADLVVEVVSPDDPDRDLVTKRREYAEAGILEYWIVNPLDETFSVLELRGDVYAEHGVFRAGETASSPSLAGMTILVDDLFSV
jgi:Uma2 family endonuclease